jgi:DNA segregation ATPase FtsK/SpoIIIE-like protein
VANNSLSKYNSKTAVGIFKRITGLKGMGVVSSNISNSSAPILQVDRALDVRRESTSAASIEFQTDATPYADNDDIYRVRFKKHGITKIKRRWRQAVAFAQSLIAYVQAFFSPKLSTDEKMIMATRLRNWTPEELEEHRRIKAENAVIDLHKQQAKLLQNRIIEKLTQLRFCHFVTKNDQVHVKKRIKFSRVDVSPYAYVYVVSSLPFGVKMTDIAQEWVTNELCATVNKKVRIELDMWGLRITVEVGSTLSIPNFVGFGDLDDKSPMPKNLPPLAFWAGRTANGQPVYRNLADAPHMIIAGSSGGGKSNMENTIACTLIRNNDPQRVRMVFFDLKGGVEFGHFEGIPHLWPMQDKKGWNTTGIIEFPTDVIPALNVLFDECMSRLAKLKKAKVKNINEYNRHRKDKRIPYIVVFFDEWASTKKLVGNEAESILSNIANLSRSAGIHFILSTQYPKAEIINTTISVNFPWRIAFNMGSGASQSVLGDWGAFGLSPVGRAVLQTMDGQMQIQTPRITNQNVLDVTEEARTGVKATRNMENVDASDILEWALNNTGGKLDQDSVFNQFREKIERASLRALLRSMENNIFDVQGTLYKVLPGAGTQPRRMILAEEAGMSADPAAYSSQPASEEEEIEPIATVTRDTEVTAEEPAEFRTCEHCGAQTDEDPCEFCGKYFEGES